MKSQKLFKLSLTLAVSLFGPFMSMIQAKSVSEGAIVRDLKGAAYYSVTNEVWLPLKLQTDLQQGMLVKTAPESTVLLQWEKSGGMLKVNPNSVVSLVKLQVNDTPVELIAQTDVALIRGSVTGEQKKASGNSQSKISVANGFAVVDGSQYHINSEGSISVVSGTASVNFPSNVEQITAGETLVVGNGSQILDSAPSGAELPKLALATPVNLVQRRERPTSPHGNNGVGNGEDPAPPGNPPTNDGPGTGPGDPGNGRPSRP